MQLRFPAFSKMLTYDDDYPTCVETYATLRCYHAEAAPEAVTEALGLQPSRSQVKGVQLMDGRQVCRPISGWFLRSKGAVESRDVRRHIDWLLDQLRGRESRLTGLEDQGWRIDIHCYWLSGGQGGPMLDPSQMAELARLNLTCGFDVHWVAKEKTTTPKAADASTKATKILFQRNPKRRRHCGCD